MSWRTVRRRRPLADRTRAADVLLSRDEDGFPFSLVADVSMRDAPAADGSHWLFRILLRMNAASKGPSPALIPLRPEPLAARRATRFHQEQLL